MVVATGVDTQERSTGQGPEASKAGTVLLQPVAILAGQGWLVTSWQERKALRGGKEVGAEEPTGYDEFLALAGAAWIDDGLTSAGDLALTLLQGAVATYPATIRALESWLESWELEFYRRMEEAERATLVDLRGVLAELRRRVSGLRRVGRDPVREWFGGVSDPGAANAADELIERSLRELRELNDALRTSLEVVAANDSARTLRLAQAESRQSDRLQEQLGLIASVLLVPTLVATVYGASTPGLLDHGGHPVMLVVMAVAGLLSYVYFRVFVYGRPPPGE
jgi:Mg2+ and Co2+ transporter CorA